MKFADLIYTIVSKLVPYKGTNLVEYTNIVNTTIVEYITIPEEKLPESLLDLGMSFYNTGFVKGKGFRVIQMRYIQRREI